MAALASMASIASPLVTLNNVFYDLAHSIEMYHSNVALHRYVMEIVRQVLHRYQHISPTRLEEIHALRDTFTAVIRKTIERCRKYDRYSRGHRWMCSSAINRRLLNSLDLISKLDAFIMTDLQFKALSCYDTNSERALLTESLTTSSPHGSPSN